jgi:protocatechuate 3,4-dioxygenase beta subunit
MSRRQVLGLAVAGGSVVLFDSVRTVCAKQPADTEHTRGHGAPVSSMSRRPYASATGPAKAAVIPQVMAVTVAGYPVPGARLEIWQANTHGRYTHPSDTNPAPLDPHFEGFAVLTTDAEGRYRFKTIKPGAYPAGPDRMRPPHMHFEVTGQRTRLVTQLYFAGEPLNDTDPFLQGVGPNKERLIVSLGPPTPELEPDARVAVWDIVLAQG